MLVMFYQLNVTARTACVTCVILGFILSVGMAFKEDVRCVTLLILPNMFSSKGRTLLLAYAFMLVITHPVQNFRYASMLVITYPV